jgi:uncharacterized protein (DUF2252 family)
VERILRFNAGRDPVRMEMKYAAMRADPFGFFRGTAHLFYEDWPDSSPLDATPLTWSCGDLHLENFGTFRGVNGLAYFDINDFDEAALAPAGRDLARLATSTVLATGLMRLPANEERALWNAAQMSYADALRHAKPLWIERATARGLIKRLLKAVKRRSQGDLLDTRTRWHRGRRALWIDGVHFLRATAEDRAHVMRGFGRTAFLKANPAYYRVIDIARRIAGTGSLGLQRFAILVHGHGGRNGNVILDLKQAAPSVLAASVRVEQPHWNSEAERVVTIQRWFQAVSPPSLHAVRTNGASYILRELQPMEDRLSLEHARDKRKRLETSLRSMTDVLAWDQLRSAGRHGSASVEELEAMGHDRRWCRPLVEYSHTYADVVRGYWKDFASWYDETPRNA